MCFRPTRLAAARHSAGARRLLRPPAKRPPRFLDQLLQPRRAFLALAKQIRIRLYPRLSRAQPFPDGNGNCSTAISIMIVADFIAESIERKRIRYVFGVGGANIEDMFSAIQKRRPNLRAVLNKHEHA